MLPDMGNCKGGHKFVMPPKWNGISNPLNCAYKYSDETTCRKSKRVPQSYLNTSDPSHVAKNVKATESTSRPAKVRKKARAVQTIMVNEDTSGDWTPEVLRLFWEIADKLTDEGNEIWTYTQNDGSDIAELELLTFAYAAEHPELGVQCRRVTKGFIFNTVPGLKMWLDVSQLEEEETQKHNQIKGSSANEKLIAQNHAHQTRVAVSHKQLIESTRDSFNCSNGVHNQVIYDAAYDGYICLLCRYEWKKA